LEQVIEGKVNNLEARMDDTDIQLKIGARSIGPVLDHLGVADVAEPYTKLFAKIPSDLSAYSSASSKGHFIGVTSLAHPTPLGSGKTSASIGLLDALNQEDYGSGVFVMRQPSGGVSWNRKGGAGGGGFAQVLGAMLVNKPFLNDFYAIDNITHEIMARAFATMDSKKAGNPHNIDPNQIQMALAMDSCAKYLAEFKVKSRLGESTINTQITTAHELLKIFSFSRNLDELEEAIGNITFAYDPNGNPIYVRELETVKAYVSALAMPFMPCVAQTLLGSPVVIHGGLFGNVGTGCPTTISQLVGEKLAKYVIVEAGFSADLGFEKLADIQMYMLNRPSELFDIGEKRTLDAVVGVVNIRDLKRCGKVVPDDPDRQIYPVDPAGVERGLVNLGRHLQNVAAYFGTENPGEAPVGASITFATDPGEVKVVTDYLDSLGVPHAINRSWEMGGAKGGQDLAAMTKELVARNQGGKFRVLYDAKQENLSPVDILEKIMAPFYLGGESNIQYREGAKEKAEALFKEHGPAQVIVAKTFLSFGDQDNLVPVPEPGYTLTVRDVKYESGADVYVVVLGQRDPRLMPGKVTADGTPKDKVVHLMSAPGWPGGYLPAGQD
jgi:formate--tetrahydrofolate ligase